MRGVSGVLRRQAVDVGVAAARRRQHRLRAALGQIVNGLQLGEATIGQPVIGGGGVAPLDDLVHRAHLAHVAAAVGDGHGSDQLRLGIHGQLRVEGRPEAAVGHLHHPRLGGRWC
jgi:hypothetical protein